MLGFFKKIVLKDVDCELNRLREMNSRIGALLDVVERESNKEFSSINKKIKMLTSRMTTLTRHNNSACAKMDSGEKALVKILKVEKKIAELESGINLFIKNFNKQLDSILNTKKK